MKKTNEKLIQYLTGEMAPGEIPAFEELLKNSPEMSEQKMKYEKLLGSIKETSNSALDNNYFTNLIPLFRVNLESGKRSRKVMKWSFSLSTAAALVILALVMILPQRTDEMNDLIVNMDQQEITNLVDDMRIDVTPADTQSINNIDEIYVKELSEEQGVLDSDLITDSDILNSLSEDESELVYREMINKDLLEE